MDEKAEAKREKNIEKAEKTIRKLQKRAQRINKKGTEYQENNHAASQYAYIYFQSMNGKQKFLDAMNIGFFKRMKLWCCKKNKTKEEDISHKYLDNKWPAIQ